MNGAERAAEIRRLLRARNLHPTIDGDGDLVLDVGGRTYVIIVPVRGKCHSVTTMGIRLVRSREAHERALIACNATTAEVKCAKAWILQDTVAVSYEANCASPEAFAQVFDRAISAIRTAELLLQQKMA